MLNLQLVEQILSEPMPCDNCEHFTKCQQLKLACAEFAMYVHNGSVIESTSKLPSTYIFGRMFGVQNEQALNNLAMAYQKYQRKKLQGKYEHTTD
jgi:hypothetical protein